MINRSFLSFTIFHLDFKVQMKFEMINLNFTLDGFLKIKAIEI